MALIKLQMTGLDELLRNLATLGHAIQGRVLRRAVRAAAKPVIQAARARIPSDTGNLKKSIGVRIWTPASKVDRGGALRNVSSGVTMAIIGPRAGFVVTTKDGQKRVATRYAHIIEGGRKTRGPSGSAKKSVRHVSKKGLGVGIHALRFLRTAYSSTRGAVTSILKTEIVNGIIEEARKMSTRGGGK